MGSIVHDAKLIYAAAMVRATATGMVGVLLGIYLAQLDFSAATVNYLVAAGLAGAAAASLVATLLADRRGRKRMLVEMALLAAAGTAVATATSNAVVIGAAAFVGMLNGMGRDRGALAILDQAILPTLTSDAQRTRAFAAYNVCQDIGHAAGALLAGLPQWLQTAADLNEHSSYRAAMCLPALLMAGVAAAYLLLSSAVEPLLAAPRRHRVSAATWRILGKLSALSAVDSLGSGFLADALLSFYFFERFDVDAAQLGLLFAAVKAANAVSYFIAAWLAQRIGLVNTMVFTHIPSSLLLVAVAFAPSFPMAVAIFVLRALLVEMDVPTRQSYVMGVVAPSDAMLASGVTNLVRMSAWATSPVISALAMPYFTLATPLFLGAGLKIAYDVALWISFRRLKPPEEAATGPSP
jgi:MFS family permease